MDTRSSIVLIGLVIILIITIIAFVIAYNNLLAKGTTRKRKGIVALLVGLGGVYNILSLIMHYLVE